MSNPASFLGNAPYTDDNSERSDASEHLQVGLVGMKQVTLLDSSGSPVTIGTSAISAATLSNVVDSASSVTVLAANSSRKGAIIHNDSSAVLYLKYGATASTSSFTYRLNPFQTLEIKSDALYLGIIDGIWASDAGGSARVTELT